MTKLCDWGDVSNGGPTSWPNFAHELSHFLIFGQSKSTHLPYISFPLFRGVRALALVVTGIHNLYI